MLKIHRVLLVVSGPHFLGVAHCLARMANFRVSVLTGEPGKNAERLSRHIRSFSRLPVSQKDAVLIDAVIREVEKVGADVLLPVGEEATRLLIRNMRRLSEKVLLPPLPEEEAIGLVMDKWSMAMFLEEKGIPTPATLLFSSMEQIREEIGRLKFPVMVKPIAGGGGEGIKYVSDYRQLEEVLLNSIGNSEKYLVQEFIFGHAVDSSVLCRHGEILAYTIQRPFEIKPDRFVYSNCVEFVYDAEALKITTDLVSSLRWSGVAHIDMQYDERNKKLMVLELNPRFWGTIRQSHAVGVNFPHLACLCAERKDFSMPSYKLDKFYDKWEALKHWTRRRSAMKSQTLGISKTMWAYILDDPLPFVVNALINIGHKVTTRLSSRQSPIFRQFW